MRTINPLIAANFPTDSRLAYQVWEARNTVLEMSRIVSVVEKRNENASLQNLIVEYCCIM